MTYAHRDHYKTCTRPSPTQTLVNRRPAVRRKPLNMSFCLFLQTKREQLFAMKLEGVQFNAMRQKFPKHSKTTTYKENYPPSWLRTAYQKVSRGSKDIKLRGTCLGAKIPETWNHIWEGKPTLAIQDWSFWYPPPYPQNMSPRRSFLCLYALLPRIEKNALRRRCKKKKNAHAHSVGFCNEYRFTRLRMS